MKIPASPYRQLVSSPTFWIFVAYVLGILWGEYFYGMLGWLSDWAFALVGVLSVLSILALFFYRERSSFALLCFAGVSCVLLGVVRLTDNRQTAEFLWPEKADTYRMLVIDAPVEKENVWQFTGRVMPLDVSTVEGRGMVAGKLPPTHIAQFNQHVEGRGMVAGKLVRCSVRKNKVGKIEKAGDGVSKADNLVVDKIRPGDEVLMHCHIEELHNTGNPGDFDYAKWLRRQGISGMAFCYAGKWQNIGEAESMPLTVQALRFRDKWVERSARYLSGRELAVFSAITLGDKTHIDKDVRHVYSSSGVSHVLALSGLHLGILFGLWQLLLKHLDHRRRRFCFFMRVLGLLGLLAFAFIAGFPKSLVRAGLMFAFMQMQIHFRSTPYSVNNLALAALVIVFFSPQAVFDIGFQLSCVSVLGILLFADLIPYPRWFKHHYRCRYLFSMLVVSVFAQLATFPLAAYYFHTISLYGLLSNFVAIPAAYLLLFLGLIFYLLPFGQSAVAMVLHPVLSGLYSVLKSISEWPGGVLHFRPTLATTLIIYVILVLCYYAFRYGVKHIDWSYIRLAFLSLVACVALELYAVWQSNLSPRILFYSSYGRTPIHFIQSSSRSYLWLPKEKGSYANEAFLEQLRNDYWAAHHMAEPAMVNDSCNNKTCFICKNMAWFDGKIVARVNTRLYQDKKRQSVPVDYLLIERGCKSSLDTILQYYMPAQIILSTSLSDYYREKYIQESQMSQIPVCDLRKEGALCIDLQ